MHVSGTGTPGLSDVMKAQGIGASGLSDVMNVAETDATVLSDFMNASGIVELCWNYAGAMLKSEQNLNNI